MTSAISDNNNILRAVKVSAPLPRGVTAPVSVSEQKIQIIILILKRGPVYIILKVSNSGSFLEECFMFSETGRAR